MRLTVEQLPEYVLTVNAGEYGHDKSIIFHINSELVIAAWTKLLNNGHGVAYGIAADGHPEGFLLGIHTEDLLTGERKAYEYLWMVLPKYRAGNTSLCLLNEFEAGALADGCQSTVIGCNAAFKQTALSRLYRRLGYRSISESFERKL